MSRKQPKAISAKQRKMVFFECACKEAGLPVRTGKRLLKTDRRFRYAVEAATLQGYIKIILQGQDLERLARSGRKLTEEEGLVVYGGQRLLQEIDEAFPELP